MMRSAHTGPMIQPAAFTVGTAFPSPGQAKRTGDFHLSFRVRCAYPGDLLRP